MRNLILLLLLSLSLFAQDKYVQPVKDTPLYEQPGANVTMTIKQGASLKVISEKDGYYRVKTEDEMQGYVSKRKVVITEGKKLTFDGVVVEGYLDNPTPIYITDTDEGQNAPIDLDRSFAESLKRNTCKERIIRIAN